MYGDEARRIDYDLDAAIRYNPQDNGFFLEDVSYVLASCFGENDGPDYWWLMSMKDGTYAVVNAWCDYTGWDCQSSADSEIFPSLKLAIESIPEKNDWDNRLLRESIKQQLNGDLTYGEALTK